MILTLIPRTPKIEELENCKSNNNKVVTLTKLDVANRLLDVFVDRITRVNHDAVNKLHRLGTLSTEFSRYNDFASFSLRFHDEAENTITSTTNSQTTAQLEAQRLALGNRAQTTIGDLLGVQLNINRSL